MLLNPNLSSTSILMFTILIVSIVMFFFGHSWISSRWVWFVVLFHYNFVFMVHGWFLCCLIFFMVVLSKLKLIGYIEHWTWISKNSKFAMEVITWCLNCHLWTTTIGGLIWQKFGRFFGGLLINTCLTTPSVGPSFWK